ncbi:hypothetical protein ACIBEJ_37555 [Nonomuraea sp. NPDC050790]|uniref:hypothetical protein n=1 Tax=Nonomuraea sp. NPDC050790 TaxID=3364371 RepID=UPI003799C5C4
MTWIFVAIGLGVAGIAVLVAAGVRVLSAARGLSRELAQAEARISPAEERLRGQIGMNKAVEG